VPRTDAYGYLQADLLPADTPLYGELTRYAADEGLALGEVFVEDGEHRTSAFAALMDALAANDVHCVIVPSLRHLARMPGLRIAISARLRDDASVDLRVLHPHEPVRGSR